MSFVSTVRVRVVVGLVLTAAFLCIVQTRTDADALFVGADRGGFWAEHNERLNAVEQTAGHWPELLRDPEAARTWIRSIDRRFPPGLYLWGALVGRFVEHEAPAVCRSMSLWWLAVALAAGLLTMCFAERRPWSFVAGYGATLAVPGLGALALTYFFDLPMIALVWLGVAAWVLLERRPPLAGIAAGLLVFAAGLFKWTALPLGGALIACVAIAGLGQDWSRRRLAWTLLGLLLAAATIGLSFWGWTSLSSGSFSYMTEMASGAHVSVEVHTRQLGPWTLATVDWETWRLSWYSVRLVTQIVGPLCLLPLLVGIAFGGRGRATWLLVGALVLHLAFFLLLVPPKDARFLMNVAPAISVAAAMGWFRAGRKGRWLAAVTLLAGMLTLLEFHHGRPGSWNRPWPESPVPDQVWAGRGLFLDVDDRLTAGWPKARSPEGFILDRAGLWDRLASCELPGLAVPADALGPPGDAPWLLYRWRLAVIRGEPRPDRVLFLEAWSADQAGQLPEGALLLLAGDPGEAPAGGPGWSPRGRFEAGDRAVGLWGLGAGPSCDLGAEPARPAPPPVELACEPGSASLSSASRTASPLQPPSSPDGRCDDLGPRCATPYLLAAERLTPEPRDCGPLLAQLAEARRVDLGSEAREAWTEGRAWSAEELGAALRDRLTLLEPRPLTFHEASWTEVQGGWRRQFILEEPVLGHQRVLLFVPPGRGPHPAVVGLLGHGQDAEQLMAEHAGQELLEAGIAVAVPVVRAYDSGQAEHEATEAMLCAGSSMMAARVSEVRNVLSLLRAQDEICARRLGLLAHSGGSLVANVLAWLQPDLKAIVTDMEGRYSGARDTDPPVLRDETHPGLRPLNLRLIDFRDAPVPTLRVRYGMPDGPEPVVAFLSEALWAEGKVPQPPPLPPPE